jgi:dephospho-CoA kinase
MNMIIGMCGRIGAGKETLTSFLREKGFVYLVSSDLINEELRRRGLEISRTNQQNVADELRNNNGVGIIMQMFLDKIALAPEKNYIIDSLRNSGEAVFLRKKVKDFVLIGVDAPQKTRFERIISRGKSSDPKTWEDFLKVDERDNFDTSNPMGQQTGKLLEISDFVIVNDGNLVKSMKQIKQVWKEIEKKNESYKGVIIEESLKDKNILKEVKILKTDVEKVTDEHKTPWIKQWTLHTVEIPKNKAEGLAEKISKSLDSEHNWYADFKNNSKHFIIFSSKVFFIDVFSKEQYDEAKKYGISLGIPDYQVDFHPKVKKWER